MGELFVGQMAFKGAGDPSKSTEERQKLARLADSIMNKWNTTHRGSTAAQLAKTGAPSGQQTGGSLEPKPPEEAGVIFNRKPSLGGRQTFGVANKKKTLG